MILKNIPFEVAVKSRGSGAQGLPQSEWISDGNYPVIGQGSEYIEGRTNRQDLLIKPNPSLILYGGHTRRAKYVDFPFVPGPNVKILEAKDQSALNHRYLFYFLTGLQIKSRGYADHFPEVKRISIPFQPLNDQIRIAHLLSKVEGLIAQRKQHLQQLDDLLKSVFLEMFGDPVRNEKGWGKPELKAFGKISTGNTPPRNEPANYDGDFIEWIKTDNITGDAVFVTPATERLSDVGAKKARTVTNGALLVACIAGSVESIGRAALTDRSVSFNQQINAIQPNKDVNPLYLYGLFKLSRAYIQSHATKGMKKILTKGDFEKITMIKPPVEIQNQFAVIVEKIEGIKSRYQQSLTDLGALYGALSQQAFKGELDLSRVPLPKPPAQTISAVSAGDQTTMSDPVMQTVVSVCFPDSAYLPTALENAEVREALIEEWLQFYLEQLCDAPFSAQDFMAAVQARLMELYPDNDFELGASDYEYVKTWVLKALVAGTLKQEFDDAGNRIELKAKAETDPA